MSQMSDEHQHPDWLPLDWKFDVRQTEFGRIRKSYIHPTNGHRFYTKPEVIRYLNGQGYAPQKRKEPTKVLVKRTVAENLPTGWIKEIRRKVIGDVAQERPVLYYIDPDTGYPFRSMKAAIRYLESKGLGDALTNVEDDGNVKIVAAEKLPPGWMKEITTKKRGDKIRKDTLYIDPVTGLYFRSLKEVFEYLGIEDKKKFMSEVDGNDWMIEESENHAETVDVKRTAAKHLPPGWLKEVTTRMTDEKIIKRRVDVKRTAAKHLPPGWLKEVTTRMTDEKIIKRRCFIDPVTGDYFRSMNKAFRYLGIKDPRKFASKANDKDYSSEYHSQSSSADVKERTLIVCKEDKRLNKGKTVKSASMRKRKESMSSLPCRSSKRLAARAPVDPTNEAVSSDEFDDNCSKEGNLGNHEEVVTLSLEDHFSFEEPGDADLKKDEKSEKKTDALPEDRLVDVSVTDGGIPPSGDFWADIWAEFEAKTATKEMPILVQVTSHQPLNDPIARNLV